MKSLARSHWEKKPWHLFVRSQAKPSTARATYWRWRVTTVCERERQWQWFIILLVLLAAWPQLESDQGRDGLAWLDRMIRKILNVNKQTLRILPGTVQCDWVTLWHTTLTSHHPWLAWYFILPPICQSVSQSVHHKLLQVWWTISKCRN